MSLLLVNLGGTVLHLQEEEVKVEIETRRLEGAGSRASQGGLVE